MQVTATEFKKNIGKYLSLANQQDIYITKNGKNVAKLTNPNVDKVALLDSLVGISRNTTLSLTDIKKERLERQ